MKYEESKEFIFLLKNGEFATPVKVESDITKNICFRSAPQSINIFGTDSDKNEVEVSESEMINEVLAKNKRTRCISPSKPKPSLKGPNSQDVVAVYVLRK